MAGGTVQPLEFHVNAVGITVVPVVDPAAVKAQVAVSAEIILGMALLAAGFVKIIVCPMSLAF
jgi:hypothetical protein